MSEPPDQAAADDALLDRLAELYAAVDPVPPGLADRVAFALELDDIEHELALLEGRLDGAGAARSAEVTRTLTFSGDTVSLMVTVTALGPGANRIDGWVTPGAGIRVEVRTASGSRHDRADATGRFAFASVPPGRVQFVLWPGGNDGRRVVTPAVEF